MSDHFIKITPELRQALDGALILTPNERLRRQLRGAARIEFQLNDQKAALSPSIQALPQYTIQQYQNARFHRPQLPAIITAEKLHAVAYATAPPAQAALTPLFLEACGSCWNYGIDPQDAGRLASELGRVGANWELRLQRWLDAHHFRPIEQIPSHHSDILEAALAQENRTICLLAIEQLSPPLDAIVNRLRRSGTDIQIINLATEPASEVVQTHTQDANEELNLASQWCHQVLQQQPQARIGVVFPDLSARHSAIRRQFAATLAPGLSSRNTQQFDIAGGEPLSQEPVWLAAAGLLRWCHQRLPLSQVQVLIGSRMLPTLSELDMDPQLPGAFDLPTFSWRQQSNPALRAMSQLIEQQLPEDTLDHWLQHFRQLLEHAAWPGKGSGSVQYQAAEAVEETFQRLSGEASNLTTLTARQALQLLDQRLARHTFAPEQPASRVLILGPLETTGLHFTHLWIAGMTANAWPAQVPGNPFLPMKVRQLHDLPRSYPAAELKFAQRRIQHWMAACDQLVLSYPLNQDDSPVQPSPLLPQAPFIAPPDLVPNWNTRTHPLFTLAAPVLEPVSGNSGPNIPPGSLKGGTGLLRDLADCSFRAWAHHRLGLKPDQLPHSFPDARDRGILVHNALQQVARLAPNNKAVASLTPAVLADLSERTVMAQFGRFPEAYRQVEITRLTEMLMRWLAFERQRSPFELVDVEYDQLLEVGQYELNLRVDRADRIGGELVVIDFKTGNVKASQLTDDDLPDPQLPAYACADSRVNGVFYAQLGAVQKRSDKVEPVRWIGLADASLDIPEAKVQPLNEGTFAEQRQLWKHQIAELILGYTQGGARVAPRNRDVCTYCNLQPFCRIQHENRPE